MKYKVGDKVKIRSWDSMEQEFGLAGFGSINIFYNFTKQMKTYCDKIVTIKKVYSRCYEIKEDHIDWAWTDDMIDHRATRIQSIIYRLEKLKKLYPAIDEIVNKDIRILKSNKPYFDEINVNYYNKKFRKIKGETK